MVLTNPVSGQSLINAVNDNTERSVSSETFLQDYRKYWWRRRTVSPSSLYTIATESTKLVVYARNAKPTSEYIFPDRDIYIGDSIQVNYDGSLQTSGDIQHISSGNSTWYITDPTTTDFGGKYVCYYDNSNNRVKIYSIDASDGIMHPFRGDSSDNFYYFNVKEILPSTLTFGDWELLSSNASVSYPKHGFSNGYNYEFLGDVYNNSLFTKTQSGYYVSTSTYGMDNYIELEFDFVPKSIIIFDNHNYRANPLILSRSDRMLLDYLVEWDDYSIKIRFRVSGDYNNNGRIYNYIVFG